LSVTRDLDLEPRSPRERLLFSVGAVLDALDELGFAVEGEACEDPDAIEVELEQAPEGAFDEARCAALAERIRDRTRQALRQIAEIVPPLASSDPGAPAAMAGFDRVARGALPAALVMRLMDATDHPSPLLSVLLHAVGLGNLESAREFAKATMELWNHTPRTDLRGRTPNQVAAAGTTRRRRRR
jgi:hypothetical protein